MTDLEKRLDSGIEEIVYLLSESEIHPLTAKKLIIRLITELKILNIPVVNQQRELLIAYTQYIFEQIGSENSSLTENMVDGFLGN